MEISRLRFTSLEMTGGVVSLEMTDGVVSVGKTDGVVSVGKTDGVVLVGKPDGDVSVGMTDGVVTGHHRKLGSRLGSHTNSRGSIRTRCRLAVYGVAVGNAQGAVRGHPTACVGSARHGM